VGSYDSQTGCDFTAGIIGQKWLGTATGKRTTVQIECPHIIEELQAIPTTEDEELGIDHGCGIVPTTARSVTIDQYAGPLSRYWSAKL
jgi:hypothetical protein